MITTQLELLGVPAFAELNVDGDKLNCVAEMTDFIALAKKDISNEVDFIVNKTRRLEILKDIIESAHKHVIIVDSVRLSTDKDAFEKWAAEELFL